MNKVSKKMINKRMKTKNEKPLARTFQISDIFKSKIKIKIYCYSYFQGFELI